ncbi:MAG: sigma-70 family RNA polymerase sigma factor [Flavobacteriaceae bacterium]
MEKEEEFTDLIREHQGIIFKITTMYCDNEQDQKDLYQDIVYQIWKSFDSFKKNSKRSTWMYRVAMNTAITHYKKMKRSLGAVPIDKVVLTQMENESESLEEKISLLYRHIHQLDLLDKGLMLLLLEGKKYEEIAEITGLSQSNVGTRISRIKRKLQEKIKP